MVKLQNLDGSKEIVFDNVSYTLNELDLGNADINLATFQGYNQVGVRITNRSLNERNISIIGYVLGDNEEEILSRKRFLQSIVSTYQDFYLIKNDYRIKVSAKASIEYGSKFEKNNNLFSYFMIDGVCGNPCFSDTNTAVVPVAYWDNQFHFPFAMNTTDKKIVFSVREPSLIKMIENKGEVDCGMTITFEAVSACSNPYIENILTDEKIQVNTTMAVGDKIVITTDYGSKSVMLNGTTDLFTSLDLDSTFLQLHEGENYLRYGSESGSDLLIVTIEFVPQYLEV